MTVTGKKFSLATDVAGASLEVAQWVPAAGETVDLLTYQPSVPSTASAILYWDYNGAKTVIWAGYASERVFGELLENSQFVGDGAKAMAIELKNNALVAAPLAAAALFRVTS
jgi:hypothetical protein